MEYYSVMKRNEFDSLLVRGCLEPIIQSEVSQKEKSKYCILMHIYIWNLERSYMHDSKGDANIKNRLLDSVGEDECGMT